MIEAYKDFWKKYIDFQSKSNRLEFWTPVLIHIVSIFIVAIIGVIAFISGAFIVSTILSILFGIFVLLMILLLFFVILLFFFFLCIVFISIIGVIAFISCAFIVATILSILVGIFVLAMIIPMFAITLRRFYDAGRRRTSAIILIAVSIIMNISFDLIQINSIAILL